MEEMKKTAVRLPRTRQKPIKTEWNARCVLFTYFQGDISSVVDEHFSRALSNLKRPQGLSSSSHSEDMVLRNDGSMPPNHWRFSSPWTKPRPEASLANCATSTNLDECGTKAMDQYPLSLPKTPPARPRELWHFSSLARPGSPEPDYPRAFHDPHLVPEPQPDGKHGPLLNLLHQDRYLDCPQEHATRENCNPVKIDGSAGLLLNLPPSSVHCKKIYATPSRGPASPRLANERSHSLERRKDLYYY
ncbi:transcription cofactor vestigial-like protein 1 [Nannospalax galili]|uniref:transcription cofactor vestigial-like protein 1 n=1 Tax=Nannospalax galili TaxID=1026970 RepID=UPI000819ABBF|nr:transcription cofactor vestigial-like protein 1 [Nannospalax galili]